MQTGMGVPTVVYMRSGVWDANLLYLHKEPFSGPCKQWLGRILGIIGQDPSVSKSNQLQVMNFRFLFMCLR